VTALPLFALVVLARAFPREWPALAAPGAAVLVLVLVFVAPLVLEPLFNRFARVADAELADDLRRLGERAGVPLREVLVSDASRRTRKQNAYVSGIGGTRRVVVYDTLLETDPRRVRLVVAHELGHRRDGHVAKLTLLAMLGAAAAVLTVWALLRSQAVLAATGASGPGDPRIAPFVLLVASILETAVLPLGAALSRRFERAADVASL
jgi:STE24 endopeptidase